MNFDIIERILWKCNQNFTSKEIIKLKSVCVLFASFLNKRKWIEYRFNKIMNKFLNTARNTLLYTSHSSACLHGHSDVESKSLINLVRPNSSVNVPTPFQYTNGDLVDSIILPSALHKSHQSLERLGKSFLRFLDTKRGDLLTGIFIRGHNLEKFEILASGLVIYKRHFLKGRVCCSFNPFPKGLPICPLTYCDIQYQIHGERVDSLLARYHYLDTAERRASCQINHIEINFISQGKYMETLHFDCGSVYF